jgi:hypothetical protein
MATKPPPDVYDARGWLGRMNTRELHRTVRRYFPLELREPTPLEKLPDEVLIDAIPSACR